MAKNLLSNISVTDFMNDECAEGLSTLADEGTLMFAQ